MHNQNLDFELMLLKPKDFFRRIFPYEEKKVFNSIEYFHRTYITGRSGECKRRVFTFATRYVPLRRKFGSSNSEKYEPLRNAVRPFV
jgi:hypothetical protein